MRAKRSFINISSGLISQLLTIAMGIIVPRLIMVKYGSETNGLIASISQIAIYMSLLEAGVGEASLQALYSPFAKDEKGKINSILAATSKFYKKSGVYYFFVVIIISTVYALFIHSSINKSTVFMMLFFTGMGGAINYFFQGKYTIFLTAEGKSYINTLITTLINLSIYFSNIIILSFGLNIVFMQLSYFILMLLQALFYKIYIYRNYKWLNLKLKPDLESIKQKSSVLIHQISSLIFSNTDTIILTLFTNLKVVSVYVMYNMLFGVVDKVVMMVNGSVTFALGQSFNEDKAQFEKFFDAYEMYFMVLVFSLFTVAFLFILPFMQLYTSGVHDINYINKWLPILFISFKLLSNARSSSNNLISIAGHFRKTQYRSILESAINLVCSIAFVQFLGIYGVLIGTIVALLYRSTDMILYANKVIMERSPWKTIKRWLTNLIIFILIVLLFNQLKINTLSYFSIIFYTIVSFPLILLIYFSICSILERDIYYYSKKFFQKYIPIAKEI